MQKDPSVLEGPIEDMPHLVEDTCSMKVALSTNVEDMDIVELEGMQEYVGFSYKLHLQVIHVE